MELRATSVNEKPMFIFPRQCGRSHPFISTCWFTTEIKEETLAIMVEVEYITLIDLKIVCIHSPLNASERKKYDYQYITILPLSLSELTPQIQTFSLL